jgi:hypothetical protein
MHEFGSKVMRRWLKEIKSANVKVRRGWNSVNRYIHFLLKHFIRYNADLFLEILMEICHPRLIWGVRSTHTYTADTLEFCVNVM